MRANPEWGATAAVYMLDDKAKCDVIITPVRRKFTLRRCDLKTKVSNPAYPSALWPATIYCSKRFFESLGTLDPINNEKQVNAKNIVELTMTLAQLYPEAQVTVTVQLCARIAFIVSVLIVILDSCFTKVYISTAICVRIRGKQQRRLEGLLEACRHGTHRGSGNEC